MGALPSPLLNGSSVKETRQQILAFFLDSFDTYESLFSLLASDEAFYQRPEKLRHPLIFYYGHTATFFINKLILAKSINERINPDFESMFAIGVDEMSWDDLNEDHYDWPSVDAVRDYRQQVRTLVADLISHQEFSLPIDWSSPMWPVVMGIEHERIHLETSSVLLRQLDLTYLRRSEKWPLCEHDSGLVENTLIAVEGGEVVRNKSTNDALYGWDNEYGSLTAQVAEFAASQYLVSNGEFLTFVNDGGYQKAQYWEEEGDRWRRFTSATMPTFWRQTGNQLMYRSLLDEIPLPLSWPADVNYHEAKAFCNWLSEKHGKLIRLPTENEWFRLRDNAGLHERRYQQGANINLNDCASSTPVDRHRHGEFYDIVGNVWQWTETPIFPYEGFQIHPLYDDFTTPTFDNKHNLIKGGSWISTGNEATRDSRYAFRRHFFQHAGFRYVQSEQSVTVSDFDYESDTQVSQYSEFHYGDEYFGVPNFAKASAQFCIEKMSAKPTRRALDLGCAVGRCSFELATVFEHVDALDFSARFINTAHSMQARGELRYHLVEEGELTSFHVRRLRELGLENTADRITFLQGDACNLKPAFTGYDLIFMGNLIDRVYSPRQLLQDMTSRINPGGLLIIASPFTWLEEYTDRDQWLGGFKDANGETLSSTDALEQALAGSFKRVGAPVSIPFVIRETKRKHQHTLSEFNVFERL